MCGLLELDGFEVEELFESFAEFEVVVVDSFSCSIESELPSLLSTVGVEEHQRQAEGGRRGERAYSFQLQHDQILPLKSRYIQILPSDLRILLRNISHESRCARGSAQVPACSLGACCDLVG